MKATLPLVLVLTLLTWAAAPGTSFAQDKIDGGTAKVRVDRLMQKVTWFTDMKKALAASKKQDKPLLWLQVVGNLDGGL